MEESDSEAFSGVSLVSVTMAMSDLLRATACWKAPNFDMSENTKVCVQVVLSDFAQNLQVGSLWGVDRLCKALEKVSEGNLAICIPLKNGRNITLFMGLETSHATAYTNKL